MADLWGIFDAWIKGHESLAAWVQAVFSVAAIGIAIWAPIWHAQRQSKENAKRLLGNVSAIADDAARLVQEFADALASEGERIGYDMFATAKEWEHTLSALGAIPLHDLPSHQIVRDLLELRRTFDAAYTPRRNFDPFEENRDWDEYKYAVDGHAERAKAAAQNIAAAFRSD